MRAPTASTLASYPNLGFDPAPGDPASVSSVADELRSTATKLVEATRVLSGVGGSDSIWRSTAATAFRERSSDLPPILGTAGESLQLASRALATWSDDLTSLQSKAKQLEEHARVARRNLADAESNPGLHEQNRRYSDPDELAAAQARLDAAVAELNAARARLDEIIERAKRVRNEHRVLVDETARILREAGEQAPDEGVFERLGRRLDEFLDDVGELFDDIWEYVQDNADLINELSNTLSTLSTVLGTASLLTFWCPPFSTALGTLSTGLGVAALAGHALAKAAGADVSVTTLVVDIVGVAGLPKGVSSIVDTPFDASTAVGVGTATVLPSVVQKTGIEDVTDIFQDVDTYLVPDTPSEFSSYLLRGPVGGPLANTLARETS